MRSLKLSFRALFRTPFVTIVAILSLALGIGANAGIYSLFNEMLLAPLPVPHPDRLVNFAITGPQVMYLQLRHGRGLRRGLQLPDVPRPRAGGAEDGIQRDRRPHAVRRQPRHARTDPDQWRRGPGLGVLLPGARHSAGARAPIFDGTDDQAVEGNT